MASEIQWFQSLPPAARLYGARLLQHGENDGTAFYETEYQYAPTLAELIVFSSVGRPTWRKILRSCKDFLEICAANKSAESGDAALWRLTRDKTSERLALYARQSGFDIDRDLTFAGLAMPSLSRMAELAASAIDFKSGRSQSLMHGDFCSSNILYHSRAGRITTIDPRGFLEPGVPLNLGDTRYDIAKLSHSIRGLYDHILAGRYDLTRNSSHDFSIDFEVSPQSDWLEQAFSEFQVDGVQVASAEIRAIEINLFLSMLPLHADRPDRQAAFMANAMRLFHQLEDC